MRIRRSPFAANFLKRLFEWHAGSARHDDLFDGYTVADFAHVRNGMSCAFGGGSLPLGCHAAVEIGGAVDDGNVNAGDSAIFNGPGYLYCQFSFLLV